MVGRGRFIKERSFNSLPRFLHLVRAVEGARRNQVLPTQLPSDWGRVLGPRGCNVRLNRLSIFAPKTAMITQNPPTFSRTTSPLPCDALYTKWQAV